MQDSAIDFFDGKVIKNIELDQNISLEEQWAYLTQDIASIDFVIHDNMNFTVDVGWYPTAAVTVGSGFRTCLIEGPVTDGAVFYDKDSTTIEQMKRDVQEAILMVQHFKTLTMAEVLNFKLRDYL